MHLRSLERIGNQTEELNQKKTNKRREVAGKEDKQRN